MILYEKNKTIFHVAGGLLLVWVIFHYTMVTPQWEAAAQAQNAANEKRQEWERGYFKTGGQFRPRPEADKALEENNRSLQASFEGLKRLEFGDAKSLEKYLLGSGYAKSNGADDPGNYYERRSKEILKLAQDLNVVFANTALATDLGILDKEGKFGRDNHAVNLVRLGMLEHLIRVWERTNVKLIKRLEHFPPAELLGDVREEDALVQFPLSFTVYAGEADFDQMMFEVQSTVDAKTRKPQPCFALRGFTARPDDPDPRKGKMVEAVVQVAALLPIKFVKENKIDFETKRKSESAGGSKPAVRQRDY